jgi:hypothetical protein
LDREEVGLEKAMKEVENALPVWRIELVAGDVAEDAALVVLFFFIKYCGFGNMGICVVAISRR